MANAWDSSPIIVPAPGSGVAADTPTSTAPWANAPVVTAKGDPVPPPTTARNVARNVAAGATEGATGLLDMVIDPFGNVIGPAIARVGGTVYDAGAHLTGLYPPMSPEQRADLYGQTPVDPAQRPLASRVVNAADQAIPGPKMADIQANTPTEQIVRKVSGAATGGGIAGGPGTSLVAAGGALAGDAASRVVPDWAAPGAELTGNYVGSAATSRAVTPVRTVTTPERRRLVEMLDTEGVPLTAGERTGSKPLIKTEQVLGQTPGSAGGVAADVARQQAEVNRAVARRAGLDTDTLTTDVLNAHRDTLGAEIGQLAASNNMQLPTGFLQQVGQVRQGLRYMKTDAAQELGARLDQLRDMITVDPAGNPIIAGPHYQNLMSDLREAITGATGTARGNLLQFRDMLRQQMEASMNPADAARWRELNRHFANTAVIQDAMGGAGAGAAEGNISLLQLRGAINRSLGTDAYGRGYGDLNDLARAGQSVLRKPPDSGSPQGIMINKLLGGSSILSAGAGAHLGGAEGAMAGAALPIVAPWAIGTAIRGRIPFTDISPGQAYLTNRVATNLSPAALTAAIQAANEERRRNTLMRGYDTR